MILLEYQGVHVSLLGISIVNSVMHAFNIALKFTFCCFFIFNAVTFHCQLTCVLLNLSNMLIHLRSHIICLSLAPSGQDPPTLRSDTPTSVIVTWQQPTSPNGDLIGYEIERRMVGSSSVFTVATVGTNVPRRYRDGSPSITPFTAYEYRIRVSSLAGSHVSFWAAVTTLEACKEI